MANTYYVTFVIDGRFVTEVEAENVDDARDKATEEYWSANFGEIEVISGYPTIVEDIEGNYLWEESF